MEYYGSHGSSALKYEKIIKVRDIKKEKQIRNRNIEIKSKKTKAALKREIMLSIMLIFIACVYVLVGYAEATSIRKEVTEIERELYIQKGLLLDKKGELEAGRSFENIYDVAVNTLGMNFATEDNYSYIMLVDDMEYELNGFKDRIKNLIYSFGNIILK